MTQKELILSLLNYGIVHEVEGKFFYTDRLDKLIKAFDTTEVDYESDIDDLCITYQDGYPEEIAYVKPSEKVEAIIAYCKVPRLAKTNGRSYLLHSIDKQCRNEIKRIMNNSAYKPKLVLSGISHYYSNADFKKSFKNFVNDGDILTMYKMMEEGKSLNSNEAQDSTTWK